MRGVWVVGLLPAARPHGGLVQDDSFAVNAAVRCQANASVTERQAFRPLGGRRVKMVSHVRLPAEIRQLVARREQQCADQGENGEGFHLFGGHYAKKDTVIGAVAGGPSVGGKRLESLHVAEALVVSVEGEQLLVASALDDLALVHDADLIRAADRGEAVGDDDGRTVTHEPL